MTRDEPYVPADKELNTVETEDEESYLDEIVEEAAFTYRNGGREMMIGAAIGGLIAGPVGAPLTGGAAGGISGLIYGEEKSMENNDEYDWADIGKTGGVGGATAGSVSLADKYGGEAVDGVVGAAEGAKETVGSALDSVYRAVTGQADNAADAAVDGAGAVGQYAGEMASSPETAAVGVAGTGLALATLAGAGMGLEKVSEFLE